MGFVGDEPRRLPARETDRDAELCSSGTGKGGYVLCALLLLPLLFLRRLVMLPRVKLEMHLMHRPQTLPSHQDPGILQLLADQHVLPTRGTKLRAVPR